MPGLYIVSSLEKEKGDEDGLVMLRIWYSFRKVVQVVKVADGVLEVYSLSLIRFDGIGDNIGKDRKYE